MRIVLLFALLTAGTLVFAQDKYVYIGLDISKPLSNTAWIKDASARIGRGGYRFFLNPRISAGLDLTFGSYNQYKPTTTVQNPTGAVTTDYFNYLYSYSAAVSGQYYFKEADTGILMPYVGLGLGANNNQYVKYYNIYKDSETDWGFLARPEAGILLKIGARRTVAAMAAIHYDYSTNKSSTFGLSGFSALGFQIGLAFLN